MTNLDKGGGQPDKGKGHPPTKGGQIQHVGNVAEFASVVLTLEDFLARHRAPASPPPTRSQSYCARCRRIEIRSKWLLKMACSVCGESLGEAPPPL